jgi:hypothetical protein
MTLQSSFQAQFKSELDAVLTEFNEAAPGSDYDDLSDLGDQFAQRLMTRARAAIHRVAGRASVYAGQFDEVLQRKDRHDFDKLAMTMGIVEALRADIEAGYVHSLPELVHGEIFGDFLQMADYLVQEGYKDAAAVLAGGTLESHLRQLCHLNDIPTTTPTENGSRPKKAEQLNSDLTREGVLSKLDSKNITAWLDLRNEAAHAKYDQYTAEQVRLMISSVRDFLTRNPA